VNKYRINEMFYSVQGEGVRMGTPNVFVRFSGCNMDCQRGHEEPNADFDCDTEFVSGRSMTGDEILKAAKSLTGGSIPGVIFTGGEPGLQLDTELVEAFKGAGAHTAIETNGTLDVGGFGLDWITMSPKVAEHAIRTKQVSEVKYVRNVGQGIPKPSVKADHKLISPAFRGQTLDKRAVEWCQQLVLENPTWRLSLQVHKWIGAR